MIADVRAPHIADMVPPLRFPGNPSKRLAQRTVYNVYSALSAMFRDAAFEWAYGLRGYAALARRSGLAAN